MRYPRFNGQFPRKSVQHGLPLESRAAWVDTYGSLGPSHSATGPTLFVLVLLATMLLGLVPDATAATEVWTGNSSGFWNSGANWNDGSAPSTGAQLVFLSGVARRTMTNNFNPPRVFSQLVIHDDYTLRGTNLILTGGIITDDLGGNLTTTIDCDIGLNASQSFTTSDAGGVTNRLVINGTVALGANTLTVVAAGAFTMSDMISGTGGFTKNGVGTLTFNGGGSGFDPIGGPRHNTYSGVTRVNDGTLELNKRYFFFPNNLAVTAVPDDLIVGDGNGGILSDIVLLLFGSQIADTSAVTINDSGLLDLNGNSDTIGSLTMNGGWVETGTGTLTLNGNVTATSTVEFYSAINGRLNLGSTTRTFAVTDGPFPEQSYDLLVMATITGGAGLTKTGNGTLELGGDNSNTYSGTTIISAGTVLLSKQAGSNAVPEALRIDGGVVRLLNSHQISNASAVTLNSPGSLDLDGFRDLIGSLSGTGPLDLGTGGALTNGGNNSSTDYSGVISGSSATFVKQGTGTLRLGGINQMGGSSLVSTGTLLINGVLATPVSVASSATLGGNGSVGPITSSGIIKPGDNGPGRLQVNGALTLTSSSSLEIQLAGSVPVSGYDQLRVSGLINLGSAQLVIARDATFAPVARHVPFVIISNTAAATPITPAFSGLPEGGTTSFNGVTYQVSYSGGNGNDVTITPITGTPQLLKVTWDGGGADGNWFTPGNWLGDNRPSSGNHLEFPRSAPRGENTNNYGAGNTFGSLIFSGSVLGTKTALFGNGIRLDSGIRSDNLGGGGKVLVALPVALNASQTFSNGSTTTAIEIASDVVANPHTLTVRGDGAIRTLGIINASDSADLVVVEGGHLLVNGTVNGRVSVTGNGELAGRGTVGRLSVSAGHVRPGDAGPGRLRCTNVVLGAATTLHIELNGTNAGVNHDQLDVIGTVDLGGAILAITQNLPQAGGEFVIVNNDGGPEDPIVGRFRRSDGSQVEDGDLVLGGLFFQISYFGGDGNDVVLRFDDRTIELGQEILPPSCIVPSQLPPAGPTVNHNPGATLWDPVLRKLYAISNGVHQINWVTPGCSTNVLVGVVWPEETSRYQRYVAGLPTAMGFVNFSPQWPAGSVRIADYDLGGVQPNISMANRFSASGSGRCFLLITNSAFNPNPPQIYFQLVRVIEWDDQAYLTNSPATIGETIPDIPGGDKPAFINSLSRYCASPGYYDPSTRLGPIIPVNLNFTTDDMTLVYYERGHTLQNLVQTTLPLRANGAHIDTANMDWPFQPVRYDCTWPSTPTPSAIQIGSDGSEDLTATYGSFGTMAGNWNIYVQNDDDAPGFNPNDEHAFENAGRIHALRNDLGRADTSEPYVLMTYRDPPTPVGTPKVKVFQVTDPSFNPLPTVEVPKKIQAPPPLSFLGVEFSDTNQVRFIGGPAFVDKNSNAWAYAAGNDGGTTDITSQYFYKTQPGFFFPDDYVESLQFPTNCGPATNVPPPGCLFPWLDLAAGTPGTPINVVYRLTWPTNPPVLRVGETLAKRKRGLPDVWTFDSAHILYDQSVTNSGVPSARLIDATSPRKEAALLSALPRKTRLPMMSNPPGGGPSAPVYFADLPPHLRDRVSYDSSNRLCLTGRFVEAQGPAEQAGYFLLNVLSAADRDLLLALSRDQQWTQAVNRLALGAGNVLPLGQDGRRVSEDGTIALTAGLAEGTGFMTLLANNSTNSPTTAGVALHVIKVDCDYYPGDVEVIVSDDPFDESITLRHSGDFAGHPENYVFEWSIVPDGSQGQPFNQWIPYLTATGAMNVTIRGPDLQAFSDNWLTCRYWKIGPPSPCGFGPANVSSNATPNLAPGWIKRVTAGINPFDSRLRDYANNSASTIVSMIQQAGPRWNGDVPFDVQAANEFGLIELYESVFRRGVALSIEGLPPVDYPPANSALLNLATKLSDLYMLVGNEAYADAQDPTIGFGTSGTPEVPPRFGDVATSLHSFQNQTDVPNLLEEELALLRGRSDPLVGLPTTKTPPYYNRLPWNFTGGIDAGGMAYQLTYNIQDVVPPAGPADANDARAMYPQGHGDAWGHYLCAIKGYYRLLRSPYFTWSPSSESVLVNGQPVNVDFQDERKFARAAAARAKTGAEIMGLTYRQLYHEDPSLQYQGYYDPAGTNRAWGLSEWGSRVGQGAFFDWVVGNAILPPEYRDGHRITSITITQVGALATYDLTDDAVITNVIPFALPSIPTAVLEFLLDMPVRSFTGRDAFISALDLAIGPTDRRLYQAVILSSAQTAGLPESGFAILEVLNNHQYLDSDELTAALREALGMAMFNAYFTNSIKPFVYDPRNGAPPAGIQKIDRTTVTELEEISTLFQTVQEQLDKADSGLNPLGLVRNAIPFDIDPSQFDPPNNKTHFEQVFERARTALQNTEQVFNRVQTLTAGLRQQSVNEENFRRAVEQQENDFTNRLVEIFGTPFPDDPAFPHAPGGFKGPDLIHYMINDSTPLTTNLASGGAIRVLLPRIDSETLADGTVTNRFSTNEFFLSADGVDVLRPTAWRLPRESPGEIQMAHSQLLQALGRFEQARLEHQNLLDSIVARTDLLQTEFSLNANEIEILTSSAASSATLNDHILTALRSQHDVQETATGFRLVASGMEGAIRVLGTPPEALPAAIANEIARVTSEGLAAVFDARVNDTNALQLDFQHQKEQVVADQQIALSTNRHSREVAQRIQEVEQLVRSEAPARYELYVLMETVSQAAARYRAVLAHGQRLLAERTRFRQQTAAQVQGFRYRDMGFRVFRNDALQKYRAQFDFAALYAYLATKTYDFETNLRESDPDHPDTRFYERIVKERVLGRFDTGGGGLAGIMFQLGGPGQTFDNLKGQLGINNPQIAQLRFSLKNELVRASTNANSLGIWREALARFRVPDINAVPDFARYTDYGDGNMPPEPGLVIPFETRISRDLNLFGWTYGPADHRFLPDNFSTKIKSVGVNFSSFRQSLFGANPFVYLIPVGADVMRCPRVPGGDSTGVWREWRVFNQIIPNPFPLSSPDDLGLTASWTPLNYLNGNRLADFRRFGSFFAFWGEADTSEASPTFQARQLIGRSVWNTRWLLVIPASSLLGGPENYDKALNRFIYGSDDGSISPSGPGAGDIVLRIEAYAYFGR